MVHWITRIVLFSRTRLSFSSNPPISCSAGHPRLTKESPQLLGYSLLEIATWISVAIFDYRVIIRGIIVNIRGVHAVVNITSWHVVYESSKNSPWDFEHGFGRSRTAAPYGITWSTSRRSRTGLWFLIYNKEQTNIWIVFMSNKFKVVFSTFIVISKQSFDMHLTFAAAYQRNKIMFNNQTLQNIKIVVLRSMFSIRTRTKSGKFETSTRYNRTRTNKKLKILDHILVHFGIFCRGLCEPYYSL